MELYQLLPIMMISKKRVNNIKVNYEEYLIELLNSSCYFMQLTSNEHFILINEQSHGECDAKTTNIQIDFKLLVPTEFMALKNKSLPNVNYNHLKDGFIYVNDNANSLNTDLQIKANNAYIKYLKNICFSNKESLLKIKDEENILSSSINNMLVNKNILAFIPCCFNKEINVLSIIKKLFNPLFCLRDEIEKDTYITFLQDDLFYILRYSKGKYTIVDKVHKITLINFMDLYRLTYFI